VEERAVGVEDEGEDDFFFCLFITRMRPIRSWRDYIQSVSCPLSAQWWLVARADGVLLLRRHAPAHVRGC